MTNPDRPVGFGNEYACANREVFASDSYGTAKGRKTWQIRDTLMDKWIDKC